MNKEMSLTRERMTTPRAAAVAGILFSVLLIGSLVLIRTAIPADLRDAATWLGSSWSTVSLALNLLPFAGIAFLWYIGVVRDRLGEYEDRFFATVFLGSGLLFLAMLFVSAAVVGGIVITYRATPGILDPGTYTYARSLTRLILNIYAVKMAGVFMIASCTLFMRTRVTPRWMAWLGYALALLLLVSTSAHELASLVFPLWILLISIHILIENYRRGPDAAMSVPVKQENLR